MLDGMQMSLYCTQCCISYVIIFERLYEMWLVMVFPCLKYVKIPTFASHRELKQVWKLSNLK